MRLSVVTAVDDHEFDPARWFTALHAQTVDPNLFEVVAVDAYALARWREAYEAVGRRRHPQPRIVYQQIPPAGRARALNVALREASGDVIVFLAADFIPEPDFVEQHRRFHLEHPELQAVGVGKALVPPELQHGPFARWLEDTGQLFGVPLGEGVESIPSNFFYVGNASVKRGLIDLVGRFDEDFPYSAWDDHEYKLRLLEHGMCSRLIPEATVVHEHPLTLAERRRSVHEAGQSAAIYAHKCRDDSPSPTARDLPAWGWRVVAWMWLLAHLVTRNERHRGLYYNRTLLWSYTSGLRQRRAALRAQSLE